MLLHIWGPIAIYSYGFFISLGLVLFILCVTHDSRFYKLGLEHAFSKILIIAAVSALFGGRILYLLSNWQEPFELLDVINVWQGGLSILGAVIGILCIVPWYLRYCQIPILPFFDFIVLYTGLLQAVSRIGCFYAGCCFGAPSHSIFSVTYTDHLSMAPLHNALHPSQLYSFCMLFFIFFLMISVFQYICKKPGQLVALYVLLISLERFGIDFLRGDRIMIAYGLSYNQIVALGLMGISFMVYWYVSCLNYSTKNSVTL